MLPELPDPKQTSILIIKNFRKIHGDVIALCEAVRFRLPETVEELLNAGIAPNSRTHEIGTMVRPGRVPLSYCSNTRIGKLLVARGADVNARDNEGNTPLIWFLRGLVRQGEARGYLKWLLSEGADPNDVSSTGETAREMALKKYGLNLDDLK